MRKDIIEAILSETNTFSYSPLAQFQVETEEGGVRNGGYSIDEEEWADKDDSPAYTADNSPDLERLLVRGLDLHDVQAKWLKTALRYDKAKKQIVAEINTLYTKWNVFLTTEAFLNLNKAQKSIAWDKYKLAMGQLKARNQKAKPIVSQTWDAFKAAQEAFKSYMDSTPGLWTAFYSLASDESQAASYYTRTGESWQEESEIVTSDDLIRASKEREINDREEEEIILSKCGQTDKEVEDQEEVLDLLASELGI